MQIDVGLVDRANVSMRLTEEGLSISGTTDVGTKFDYHRVRQVVVHIDEPKALQLIGRVRLEVSTEEPSP